MLFVDDNLIASAMNEQLNKHGCKVNIKKGFYFTDKDKGCNMFIILL